ncbi:hypothetical protein [Sphingopyxis sp. KK2]|uniref:hypothetical protein n=1 Tax=Sphingopyxis sp. KK2 TaxID=1855727 RepID=UPI00097E5F09|nr:hypothetical protein [Sphingopyxis sp. KK2]
MLGGAPVTDQLDALAADAAAHPERWGNGVRLNITCARRLPYEAVQLAGARGFAEARGVGRHHLIFEYEDVVPDAVWVAATARPVLDFIAEVGGTDPQIGVDRNVQ